VAYDKRGMAFASKREYDTAITDYNEAIRLDPTLAAAFNHRGNAHYAKGDDDRAIADYNEAIRLDPQFVLAYRNRGISNEKKGELEKALADYKTVKTLNPQHQEALAREARIEQQLKTAAKHDAEIKCRRDLQCFADDNHIAATFACKPI